MIGRRELLRRVGKRSRVGVIDGAEHSAFIERLLGWDDASVVDHALRSADLAATLQAALVLCGDGDLLQIARGLHRRVLGDERPFVLCDPRRRDTDARAPIENHKTGMEALRSAADGSVCMRSERLPRDFADVVAAVRAGTRVHLIIYGPRLPECTNLVMAPIKIPAVLTRRHELDRIVDEYAQDATVALRSSAPFTETNRTWVRKHSAKSLPEIEKGAWRILEVRHAGSARLGGRCSVLAGDVAQELGSGAGLAPRRYKAGDDAGADRPAEPLVEGLIFGGESVALSG